MSAQKVRLDQLLVQAGLSESRNKAQRIIMAGEVRVDGQVVFKPAHPTHPGANLEIEQARRFVSRGGEKLEAAISVFDIEVQGKLCADIGASTGGFTDVLLQRGAQKVFAVDVGEGQLHWKLRTDPRVSVMEGVNARYLASLPEIVDILTVDVSFISLKLILPQAINWLNQQGDAIVLIKPQFEAGSADVGKGGIVRDEQVHANVLSEVLRSQADVGWQILDLMQSPLKGAKGNVEFLAWLRLQGKGKELDGLIRNVLDEP